MKRSLLKTSEIALITISIILTIYVFILSFYVFYVPGKYAINFYFTVAFILSFFVLLFIFIYKKSQKSSDSENEALFYKIQLFIGFLWLIDGILQFQPEMPYDFLISVIFPSISIYPQPIFNFLNMGYEIWTINPIIFNSLAGSFQIFIGINFLFIRKKKIIRFISIISISWLILIYVFGEGMGDDFVTGVTFLTGFPGSSLIYIILTIPLLHPIRLSNAYQMKRYFSIILSTLFIISAFIQILPLNGYFSNDALSQIVQTNTYYFGVPYVVSYLQVVFWHYIFPFNSYVNLMFAFILLYIGIGLFIDLRFTYYVGILFTIIAWFFFQSLGFFQFPATDPNSGLPIIIIFLILINNFSDLQIQKNKISTKNTPKLGFVG